MPVPNFFIVGAPKSGTSAMRRYLMEHPRVFMSALKEPHYFSTDITDPVVRAQSPTREWYLSLFEEAGEAEVIGEASVFYLFSEVAAEGIRSACPEARLLVMLRNPVDLVYSLHTQLLFTGQETEKEFESAWRLQGQREGSPLLEYGAVGKLGEQVRRLWSSFDRRQVHVTIYDDFARDAGAEYEKLLRFLDLPSDGRSEFPIVNPSHRHKNDLLRRVIEWLPEPKLLKRVLGIERIGLGNWLFWKNVERHRRPPLAPAFRTELCDYFAEDVRFLSSLLGRDLSHWSGPSRQDAANGDEEVDDSLVLW